jgi:chromosome segregation ATPase
MKRVGDISASVATKRDENDMSSSTSSLRRSSLSPQKSSSTSTESVDENMILHLREVNIAREMEVKRLRGVLMEKDREICNLYMHLSTKKKLVEEISTRFLEQLKASGAGKECSLDELNLNLDMFLFKNVVEKQKTVDELTAALGVMEREVESLEARADKFESENYRLKNAEEDLGLALESANSELVRISAENELMESSLKEKQTRVRNLMLYLEEKEEQIVRLKDSTQHNLLL